MIATKHRILSIDILRGLVMVIMALDHTRDYFHHNGNMMGDPMNPETTNLFLYFTRWITHFCAPIFVFLSGISAYLSAKNKTPNEAGLFLIKRGIWLLVVEIVLITLGLTFNPFYNFIILQVIWAIGWSMIILGLLSRFSQRFVLAVGILLFFGHNLLDYLDLPAPSSIAGALTSTFFTARGTVVPVGSSHFIGVFYAILPWTGAMLLGFSIGKWYDQSFNPARRRKLLFYSGLGLFSLFLVLRYFNSYGNPDLRNEDLQGWKAVFDFFNVSKYPPSLQYYGMTLGPALMLLAGLEKAKNWFTALMMVYGNVPFFYYVLHFYLLHTVLVICFYLSGYGNDQILTPQSPFLFRPNDFGYALPVVYLIWLAVVAMLYQPCDWFRKYKITHTQWWLKYL